MEFLALLNFLSEISGEIRNVNISVNYSGIFDNLYSVLMNDLMVPLSYKFNSVITFLQPIFITAFGLFISVYGYMILAGRVKAPAQDFFYRAIIILIVFWLSFTPIVYEKYIVKPVFGATTALTKVISPYKSDGFIGFITSVLDVDEKTKEVSNTSEGLYLNNRGIFMGLDAALSSINIVITGMLNSYLTPLPETDGKKNSTKGIEKKETDTMTVMLLVGFIGLIVTGAVMIYVTAGSILMLNHVFLVLLLMLGPLFVAMAGFKVTREYSKRWLSRLLGFGLTIAIVSAIVSFVLGMQGQISTQMCKATIAAQRAMQSRVTNGTIVADIARESMKRDFDALETQIKEAASTGLFSLKIEDFKQNTAALKVVTAIKTGCELEAATPTTNDNSNEGVNVMFYAIQYLIICLLLNRLISESANVSSALVNSTGLNSSTQEVSGGAQGVMSRAGQSSGNTGSAKMRGNTF